MLHDQLIQPSKESVDRKEAWLAHLRQEARSSKIPVTVRVQYKIHNKEIARQIKFFNGPVVEYWVIQKSELLDGRPSREEIARARETLLSEALGYKVELWDRTEYRRKSSAEFTDVQEWHDFLETLRETEFEPNGYEMPSSDKFWEIAKDIGYDKAKEASIQQLQRRIKAKLKSPE